MYGKISAYFMNYDGRAMLEKPTPPGEYECCESGCEPCVWDIYYEDMREWKEAQEKLKAAQESQSADAQQAGS